MNKSKVNELNTALASLRNHDVVFSDVPMQDAKRVDNIKGNKYCLQYIIGQCFCNLCISTLVPTKEEVTISNSLGKLFMEYFSSFETYIDTSLL
jgi:hypothetical protein